MVSFQRFYYQHNHGLRTGRPINWAPIWENVAGALCQNYPLGAIGPHGANIRGSFSPTGEDHSGPIG